MALAFPAEDIHVIVPARMGSKRLRGKPLADLAGVPLLVRVLRGLDGPWGSPVVATDSQRVAEVAAEAGCRAVITGPSPSGTHRVRKAWEAIGSPDGLIVNLQGDEPQADGGWVSALASVDPEGGVTTLARPAAAADVRAPSAVKVVTGKGGRALYFSRSLIPHGAEGVLEHVGAYAFTPDSLRLCTDLPPSPLCRAERLEQLAWLEAGVTVTVVTGDFPGFGVDTPEDLKRAASLYPAETEGN
mgnify:CR=1 FL=1